MMGYTLLRMIINIIKLRVTRNYVNKNDSRLTHRPGRGRPQVGTVKHVSSRLSPLD